MRSEPFEESEKIAKINGSAEGPLLQGDSLLSQNVPDLSECMLSHRFEPITTPALEARERNISSDQYTCAEPMRPKRRD